MKTKQDKKIRLKKRIRSKINGTTLRPRLSIFRSNKYIYAQIIDDTTGKTLGSASDLKVKKGTKNDRAKEVGHQIGNFCLKNKIKEVVFDRSGFKYTGRIKLLADEARTAGLKF